MLDLAWGLYELGYAPVPLGPDKRPLRKWGAWRFERPTRAEVQSVFAGTDPAGVAAICGRPHDSVILDFDTELSFAWGLDNLPAVRGVKSRRGGHLHFRHPAGRVVVMTHCGKGAIEPATGIKIDVKGVASYVVMPYSRHPSGHTYEALGNWTMPVQNLPPLPESIARLCIWRPRPAPPPPTTKRGDSDPEKAIDAYLRKAGGVPVEGSGSDDAVFRAASWCKANVPTLTEAAFVAAIRQYRPEFSEAWISQKWNSARGTA